MCKAIICQAEGKRFTTHLRFIAKRKLPAIYRGIFLLRFGHYLLDRYLVHAPRIK